MIILVCCPFARYRIALMRIFLLFLCMAISGFGTTARAQSVMTPPTPFPASKPYLMPYVGEESRYVTKYEDTLVKIARRYDLGFNELRSANPDVDPWLPGAGVELILPARHLLPTISHEGIVINLPEMRLYYFYDPDEPPLTHPLGVGREGLSTPSGQTRVIRKTEGPTWRPTLRMRTENPELPAVVPAGPENPLGTHALYLGWPEYALHGTNRPFGIGRRVSSGCIRLYPEDILTFYDKVPVGTMVRVVNQPVKLGWIDDALYLEAHAPLDQADKIEQEGGQPTYSLTRDEMAAIVTAAGDEADQLDWALVRQIITERTGRPTKIFDRKEKREEEKPTPVETQASDKTPQKGHPKIEKSARYDVNG